MKKLIVLCLLLLSISVSQSAMVIARFKPPTGMYNGFPAKYVKIHYGGQLRTYTNSVQWPLTNINTNVFGAYDLMACEYVSISNCVNVPIHRLTLNAPFYHSYSIINEDGVESAILGHAVCSFTITNAVNIFPPPKKLRAAQ